MSRQNVPIPPSHTDDAGAATSQSNQLFAETPSGFRRVLGWLGLVMGTGLVIFGCLAILAFVPGMTTTEHTPDLALFGYCVGGILILIGAVIAKIVLPSAFGWRRTFMWKNDRLIAAHGRKTRTVLAENITGLTIGRGASSPIVITVAGEKPLKIPQSVPRVGELVALVESKRPVAAEAVSYTAPSPVPTAPAIQSDLSWEQTRARTMADMDDAPPSSSSKPQAAEPPLWCIKLLTGGLALVGMAFYLHTFLYAQIATGERTLDRCWFGYAMLYEAFGPTLAVFLLGGIGLLLAVGGVIGIGATAERKQVGADSR